MALFAAAAVAATVLAAEPSDEKGAASLDQTLPIRTAKWKGDLGGMAKRGVIRALVVYSRMFYFIDGGTQRGGSYDALTLFEKYVNERLGQRKIPVRILFYPVRRDQIIPMLLSGEGDLAAADLTITPERLAQVDFSAPIVSHIDEIAVTGPASPRIDSVEDLSGHEVFVRKSSSSYDSLERLNAGFAKDGRAPVRLRLAPEDLQDEDLLELLNAGLVQCVVADDDIADFWSKIYPHIRPHAAAAVARRAETGWMFRKDSPELKGRSTGSSRSTRRALSCATRSWTGTSRARSG